MEEPVLAPCQYASFLIRLWREVDTQTQQSISDWQGEIEHIQSGRHWTLDSLERLFDLIRQEVEGTIDLNDKPAA